MLSTRSSLEIHLWIVGGTAGVEQPQRFSTSPITESCLFTLGCVPYMLYSYNVVFNLLISDYMRLFINVG